MTSPTGCAGSACGRHEQLGVRPDASPTVRASVQRLLTTLEDEVAELEQAIAQQVQRPATVQAAEQRLRTVPAVGARVALPRHGGL